MINDNADTFIKELFGSTLYRYQIGWETAMKDSDFIFDCSDCLSNKCHKVFPKCGGSYIDSPIWINIKTATVSSIIRKVMINTF